MHTDSFLMGSPLEPTIYKFYIPQLVNKIFNTIIKNVQIYVHYVDDIFIATQSYDDVNKL